MNTAVLEREEAKTITIDLNAFLQVEPVLRMQAEAVLSQNRMTVNKAVDLLLRYIVSLKKLPDALLMPPIPCLDEMTDEDFDEIVQAGFDDIAEGRTYTPEEVREMLRSEYGKL